MIGLEGFGAQTADTSARKPGQAKAQPNAKSNGQGDGTVPSRTSPRQGDASATPTRDVGATAPAAEGQGADAAQQDAPPAQGFDVPAATAGEADFADVLTTLDAPQAQAAAPVGAAAAATPVPATPVPTTSLSAAATAVNSTQTPAAGDPPTELAAAEPHRTIDILRSPAKTLGPAVPQANAAQLEAGPQPAPASPAGIATPQSGTADPLYPAPGQVVAASKPQSSSVQAPSPQVVASALAQDAAVDGNPAAPSSDRTQQAGRARLDPPPVPATATPAPQSSQLVAAAAPVSVSVDQVTIAQPAAGFGQDAGFVESLLPGEDGPELPLGPGGDRRTASLQPILVPLPANGRPATHAAAIANNLAAVVSRPGQDRVEIRLDPPELGRVSMTLAITDQAVTALVSAERPEIADLMRRHAELLQRDLAEAGYDDVDLQFGTTEHGADQDDAGFDHAAALSTEAGPGTSNESAPRLTAPMVGDARLDIRI